MLEREFKQKCTDIIRALLDGLALNTQKSFCLPEAVTMDQVVDIVKKHLYSSPESRHWTAVDQVHFALEYYFACK